MLHSNLTPSLRRFVDLGVDDRLGRRKSGMPYFSTPPGWWKASYTVTSQPALAMSAAQAMPAGPEPTMPTLKRVGSM